MYRIRYNNCIIQVNLCQKLFFLQNMGTSCVQKLLWMSETISVHNMFSPGLSLEILCIELVIIILWVSWCKNKSFWQRFTCIIAIWTEKLQSIYITYILSTYLAHFKSSHGVMVSTTNFCPADQLNIWLCSHFKSSHFLFLGVLGSKFFSSRFFGVLRKQYFHDFACMKDKKGAKFQSEAQIE